MRLQAISRRLAALDRKPPPKRGVKGGDYAYDLLLALQKRRRAAPKYETSRLMRALMGIDEGRDEL